MQNAFVLPGLGAPGTVIFRGTEMGRRVWRFCIGEDAKVSIESRIRKCNWKSILKSHCLFPNAFVR